MKTLLSFFVVTGIVAGAIAFVVSLWPLFVGLGALSFLALVYLEWRKAAYRARRERFVREQMTDRDEAVVSTRRDEIDAERVLRLDEIAARLRQERDEAAARALFEEWRIEDATKPRPARLS